MALCEPCAVSTPRVTCFTLSLMSCSISFVDAELRSASWLTAWATTAKPRPCSPARAASMEAFRARRFVWSAMSEITDTMPPIFSELSAIRPIPWATSWTARAPSTDFSTDFAARSAMAVRFLVTSSMAVLTCSIELDPSATAAAWAWACSDTWSTEALNSSTEALVSSRAEACVCAPSDMWAAAELKASLEDATR